MPSSTIVKFREILLTTLLLISDLCSPVYPGAPYLPKLRGVALTRKLLRRGVRVQVSPVIGQSDGHVTSLLLSDWSGGEDTVL